MSDSGACRSELNLSALQVFEVAHAVFVFELAADNVAPNEEFGVGVSAKTCAFLHAVFVDYTQGTERLVPGVVVGCKRKGVEGVQPAVVSMAASIPRTLDDLQRTGG